MPAAVHPAASRAKPIRPWLTPLPGVPDYNPRQARRAGPLIASLEPIAFSDIPSHMSDKPTLPDKQAALLAEIDEKIGEVRTDAIDISFGEIINLKSTSEIKIDPEYQRLFRWSNEQKSRLVESILLRLPVPPVFFIENEDGTLELIDGLQRISTMIQLIEPSLINAEPLELSGCDIIDSLNRYRYEDFPLALKLQLKRATVRAVIIKRQSKSFLRYEMFKRLNTGGSLLSPQELRNCSARLFGDWGVQFYNFLVSLASDTHFWSTTESLSDVDMEKRGREELVLRYFAAKNGANYYQGHVGDWLDGYMEQVLLRRETFEFSAEEKIFRRTFRFADRAFGADAFCKFKDNHPTGGLAPAYYEAISIAITHTLDICEESDPIKIAHKINVARQGIEFRENVGAGANKKSKLFGRVSVIEAAIKS